MRLYLDDDSEHGLLVRLLQRAGHDVLLPREVGLTGKPDAIHLQHSVRLDRSLLTANYRDFEILHDLILEVGGTHSGILIVRRDNDRRRDLTPRGIVTAISHLTAAGAPIQNEFIILNDWR